jgi:hypothetical protein
MAGYDYSLDREAVAVFAACSATEQRFLRRAIEELARHPFSKGDCALRDERGHDNQLMELDAFVISFWTDHAVRVVRITVVERV